jgi:hypothetical protein
MRSELIPGLPESSTDLILMASLRCSAIFMSAYVDNPVFCRFSNCKDGDCKSIPMDLKIDWLC